MITFPPSKLSFKGFAAGILAAVSKFGFLGFAAGILAAVMIMAIPKLNVEGATSSFLTILAGVGSVALALWLQRIFEISLKEDSLEENPLHAELTVFYSWFVGMVTANMIYWALSSVIY